MTDVNEIRVSTGEGRAKQRLLIAFVDLSMFARDAEHRADDDTAAVLDRYYERVGDAAAGAGGRVVKVIGDGALLAFPVERADDAVVALLELRDDVCALLRAAGWLSHLVVKAHVGEVVAGAFGPKGDKRFDVVGGEVNVAARLPTRNLALSAEAFRALAPATRQRFKKHTLPVTYIPVDDARPSAMTKL